MRKPPPALPAVAKAVPEHKTKAAQAARAALKPHTESYAYNFRSRNNLKRGAAK